ncbi:hypothetical protein [Thermodesulfatator atlanticus]
MMCVSDFKNEAVFVEDEEILFKMSHSVTRLLDAIERYRNDSISAKDSPSPRKLYGEIVEILREFSEEVTKFEKYHNL